ncbi:MAG: AAA family ATPase [Saprospiraceae bacterium]|nr:AAA family ATPase [Saprospiraceae bacterium]
MIYSFQQITAILKYLRKQVDSGAEFKYKIVKHLNHATSIYIYDKTGQFQVDLSNITIETPIGSPIPTGQISVNDNNVFPPVDVRYISEIDYEEDKAHYDDFFSDESSFEGVTRRLDNAFGKYPQVKSITLPPIVSFYSYKGGVGRTTILAALASFHARRMGAKVLILDCDFEAPGLVNFFGMNEDDLAAKGGIVEYLTDIAYLQNKDIVDISQYIHTISAGASKDPLGYAGDKGIIYVMNAGNVSVNKIDPSEDAPADLQSHQDHFLHGLARLDFSNAELIIEQFQDMLLRANDSFHPDVILIDSRTGFNDIFNNVALRLSDIVVGLFGTSKQNIPGLYNFLDIISAKNNAEDQGLEIVLANSIASNVRQSFKNFKKQIEQYNQDTGNEWNPEVFAIEYIPRMAEIGTPTDDGDILLDYTDPNRYSFPDYQNGKGDRLLEYLSYRIEKKNLINDPILTQEVIFPNNVDIIPDTKISISNIEILEPLSDFFMNQNISHAENLRYNTEFLNEYYYFRNYLRDLFLKETFIVRGYKGTGKTMLYHALEDSQFVNKLKQFTNITDDFRFVNIVDPENVLELSALNFKPQNTGDRIETYYRRFWIIYIWNSLLQKFPELYQSEIPCFSIMSDETTRRNFENLMRSDKILEIEFDLKRLNEIFITKNIKVVISFDYLDKVVATAEWSSYYNPISQLIKFGQFNPYSSLFPKIFIRTDLFNNIQGINNVIALENKILSLDWTTDELFAYFFKVVYKKTENTFIQWLHLHNPDKEEYILSIEHFFQTNDAQIPLEQKEILEFLVNNFFGEYINEHIPNFGRSYEWFYINLKNANDVISLRPFIALLAYCLKNAVDSPSNNSVLLPGNYFSMPAAREAAAATHLKDIWKDYPDTLQLVLETLHKSDPRLDRFRHHSITASDLSTLIRTVFEIENRPIPQGDEIQSIIKMLQDAGIIRYNSLSRKYPYSFAFLYKYYLKLKGSPLR